ncbi:hypothetical protein [Natronolimnobius baerhuensis]|uniref:Uncharacterized protein n=1 Tax=Natronolimnobius baerhuensis TaxID=253108 RepID=A0A202E925_9EURY|nr:hypothetical protein [Natronolimnobius baerhuensis]OVE84727.1 hypothetical protein B2G88_10105 [Natronolimnobius baerhuensis]
MSRNGRDRTESPWYCPQCVIWVGWKHDECLEGHDCPRLPLRYDDIETDNSWQVTRRDRLRGTWRSLADRLSRGDGDR